MRGAGGFWADDAFLAAPPLPLPKPALSADGDLEVDFLEVARGPAGRSLEREMIEFSASVLEEARTELANTVAEAERQLSAGKPLDALLSLRWVGEALSGKPLGDGPLWPEAKLRKAIAMLLRAMQEEAPRGDPALVSLRESFLVFKSLEERVAEKRDRLFGGRPHEIKAAIAMMTAHATYLLDEYEYQMKRQGQTIDH